MDGKHGREATAEEVQNAVETIDDRTYLRFRAYAQKLMLGTKYGIPEDLVHDAIRLVLEGERIWKIDVPFNVFIFNVMRSLVSNHRESASVRRERSILGPRADEATEAEILDGLGFSSPAAETLVISDESFSLLEQEIDRIEQHFKDDDDVQFVLMGKLDGLTAKEIVEDTGMIESQFKAADRRLRRFISVLKDTRSMQ